MDSIRTRLRQSVSLHRSVGVAMEEEEAGGGAQRVEVRFVTSQEEEEEPSSDITALVLRGRRAFLLAYAVFGGRCHSTQVGGWGEEDWQPGGGAKPPAEGGAGLYLGELRVMMRKLLQDEDIHNTVSRVSRASHPPGSAEGTSLASEILRRFRRLQMDHTWTESLYATLQFPH
eukprot:superscaffoldBa00012672_g25733